MVYVKSKNIKVYPSGYRGLQDGTNNLSYNPESKLNTESNATRTARALITYNNDSIYKGNGDFVISQEYHWSQVPKEESSRNYEKFEFLIQGYYVKILDSYEAFKDLIATNPNQIYAKILFATGNIIEKNNSSSSVAAEGNVIDGDNIYITGRHLANLKAGEDAGELTPANHNDDAQGSFKDFSSLDQVITDVNDNESSFTGIEFVTSVLADDNHYYFKILELSNGDYQVPTTSKLIIGTKNIHGGTEDGTDKSINEYFNSNKIDNNTLTTNNLYLPPLKDNIKNRNLVINSSGKVDVYDILNPEPNLVYDDIKFVTIIKQDENGQVTYDKAEIQKASNSQYGVIKGNYTSYSDYGKHAVKIDNNGYGYVEGITDGLPVEVSDRKFYIIGVGSTSGNNYSSCSSDDLYYMSTENKLYVPNIHASGEIRANNFYATSDKRLKENLETFKYGPSILDLPIYRYDYIDGDKNQIGCLAQDLHELYPELVREDKDCYLSIQENKLVYLLIEEVKRLTKRVEKLEEKSK